MSCIALTHVAFEDLGIFAPTLEARTGPIVYRRAGSHPPAPADWLDADLFVILGGPIGLGDQARYPWLADEIAGLRARLARDLPTLGICLGAQLIAAALGARVYPGPAPEIGWAPLMLTDHGIRSPLSALEGVSVLHWHGDTFDLPPGARRLARTESTPNQAFALGERVLGLQFHVEADPSRIEEWLIGHTVELGRVGIDPWILRRDTAAFGARATRAGVAMLEAWLSRAQPPA